MRFLDFTDPVVHVNLAIDEAILQEAEDGRAGPILRVWEQPDWCVVLGASGRTGEDVNMDRAKLDGVRLARRSSGGGTVLIGPGALNFAVVLPVDREPAYAAVDVAQKAVLARSAEGFNRLVAGGAARLEVLGSGDLALDRRKVSGSAQRRLRRHFLVHASLLYDIPPTKIARYLRQPKKQPEYRAGRPHDDFVANFPQSRANLVEGLRWAWKATEEVERPSPELLKSAFELAETKFARLDWIERL